jgi:hypothetical protein
VDANATAPALTVNAGGKLTINDTYGLNATSILLKSHVTDGTATIKDLNALGGLTVSGTKSIEQYLTTGRNWYVSSPVATALSSVFGAVAPTTNKLYWYNEPQGSSLTLNWPQISDNVTTLGVTRGYVANMPANGVITFMGGALNTGAITTGVNSVPALSRTTGQTKEGFNLVGNPYPSYLNWSDVATASTNVDATMWYRTKVGVDYKYYTYLTGTGALEQDGITVPAGVSNLIPPMQAFWVRVTAGQTSGTLAFTNSMRAHKDISGNALRAPSAKKSTNQLIRLQVSNGISDDETVVYFNPNVTNGLDNYDSPKMFNNNDAIPELYTTVDAEKLVINGMQNMPLNQEIALGFVPGSASSFSIKANEISNLPSNVKVILKDNVTLAETDLTDGATAYQFAPEVSPANRFSILFRTPGAVTGMDNTAKLNAQVFVNAANQIVIIAPEKSNYSIYNAVGMFIENGQITAKLQTANCKLQTGIYFVTVSVNGQKEIQKVVIR